MNYKLIALDMDGTLLNSKQEISNRTIDAIDAARKKDKTIVLSTGRMLSSAQDYARELELDSYIIACNGAVIIDGKENIISSRNMNLNKLEEMMDIGKTYDIYCHFYDTNTIYTGKYVEEIADFYIGRDSHINYKVLDDIKDIYKIDNLNAYKIIFIDDDSIKLNRVKDELVTIPELTMTKSWSNNIEVMDKGVSKGLGLEFLCKKLNISKEEVIAVGDNENDLSMIKYAGLGVAMGNAEDLVKEQADYITSTNDEDGVAKVIEKFM